MSTRVIFSNIWQIFSKSANSAKVCQVLTNLTNNSSTVLIVFQIYKILSPNEKFFFQIGFASSINQEAARISIFTGSCTRVHTTASLYSCPINISSLADL